MNDMLNVAFQQAWFGPMAPVQPPRRKLPKAPGGEILNVEMQNAWFGYGPPRMSPLPMRVDALARNWGPFDGPLEAGIHAQAFAPFPVAHPMDRWLLGSERPSLGQPPVFCEPGHIPVPTGVPGQSRCVPYSPPSTMFGASEFSPYRTFPVGPGYWNSLSGAGPGLGQTSLSESDAAVIVTQIEGLRDRWIKLMAFQGRPDFRTLIGTDLPFWEDYRYMAGLAQPVVLDAMARLAARNPEDFYWREEENAALLEYANYIARLEALAQKAQAPKPVAPSRPGGPAPVAAPPPAAPAPTVLGIPTTVAVVGGGVLAAALIVALAS